MAKHQICALFAAKLVPAKSSLIRPDSTYAVAMELARQARNVS